MLLRQPRSMERQAQIFESAIAVGGTGRSAFRRTRLPAYSEIDALRIRVHLTVTEPAPAEIYLGGRAPQCHFYGTIRMPGSRSD
jgi:hypothetical protein